MQNGSTRTAYALDIMNVQNSASSELISVLKQYLVSYFWVTATISTNGRIGDMNPITPAEMAFSCVVMVGPLYKLNPDEPRL
jgi:hypothetical protein